MSNEIQIFKKAGAGNIRAFLDENGEPLFVGADVARILGYGDASHMTRRLDDDEKGLRSVETPGGVQTMSVITEAGLYNAVLGSKVPSYMRERLCKFAGKDGRERVKSYGALTARGVAMCAERYCNQTSLAVE